ncbi:EF-P 5-aminopentanol modification-associated protein YfmF [Tepidibacillus sp. LV47]|uniref:EF-P 5-aminopentanol modification-associated protein YfmF n=1 Tax=Tepidibacillus sp. LV47 TaxID=3398228 RepID=UPI003AABC47C
MRILFLDQFSKKEIHSIQVHHLQTDKYKTNTIVVNIATDLIKENVTKVALLPYILKRGSKKYPSLKQIQEKLDDLYGVTLDAYVFKRGERQIVQFSCEVANEKYLNENRSLLKEAIDLLGNLITQPLIEDQGFQSIIFETEKELLAQRIKSILDDKIQYAEQKMIENMCKNEPYRLPANGCLDDLAHITKDNLYQFYQEWMNTAPIDFFIVGDYDESIVHTAIAESFQLPKRQVKPLAEVIVDVPVKEEKIVVEALDVKQGKLNLGLRTYTTIQDDDYIPMLLFNGVLGGFAHSKLFVNVREKASLAYYASSKLDSHKGIMIIQSGIEIKNYDKAVEIIKQQVQMMKEGKITEQEINQTKAILTNQLKEMLDRPRQLIDYTYHGVLSQKPRTLSQMIEQTKHVTIDDLIRVGQKVKLDTIYFLKDHVKEDAN